MKSRIGTAFVAAAIFSCGITQAQIPHKLNYQGFLTNPSGAPINGASLQMVFNIYNVQTLGTALHAETQTVTFSNGIFNRLLDTNTALTLPRALAQVANSMQIALLRWYDANLSGNTSFAVGAASIGVAFDGDNIWVASNGNNTVTRLWPAQVGTLGVLTRGARDSVTSCRNGSTETSVRACHHRSWPGRYRKTATAFRCKYHSTRVHPIYFAISTVC